jgi:hypothetical protein
MPAATQICASSLYFTNTNGELYVITSVIVSTLSVGWELSLSAVIANLHALSLLSQPQQS